MSELRKPLVNLHKKAETKLLKDPCFDRIWKFFDEVGLRSGGHRMRERSFFYKGRQFPVCARCTGVGIGQLTALVVGFFRDVPLLLSLFFLSVMGADWGLQEYGKIESTNKRRLITGFMGGFGLFSIYILIAKKVLQMIKCRHKNK